MAHCKAKLDTSSYLAVHGKPPHGRGCWAFQILDVVVYCSEYHFDAATRKVKKVAAQLYRDRGLSETPVLTLLPEWRPET